LLRARQKLGKYRILGRIASGPLADVYRAVDTVHKTRVALKIPKLGHGISHEDFLHEVQVAFKLDHPNILKVQDASFIDDQFVIAMELGMESLADRIVRRISTASALEIAEQTLAALAHAHEKKIIHCDVKPENFILFPENRLKLADSVGCFFGRSRVVPAVLRQVARMAVPVADAWPRQITGESPAGICADAKEGHPARSGRSLQKRDRDVRGVREAPQPCTPPAKGPQKKWRTKSGQARFRLAAIAMA